MSIAANLIGIRVDQATQRGSVYDVIQLVTQGNPTYSARVFARVCEQHAELHPKWVKLRINGKGKQTPVADAATLVEVAWLCPGKAAVQFRRKGAESVCRMLGGDLALVDEIQRRHAQVAGTAEEDFLLAQDGSTQQVVSHKRCLDDDDEVYAAKKQQVLRQIRQETAGTELTFMKQHAQGSMGILDILSAGNTPPATMQLLHTIRHNVTTRLGSMIESSMQGMLAIEARNNSSKSSASTNRHRDGQYRCMQAGWDCRLQL